MLRLLELVLLFILMLSSLDRHHWGHAQDLDGPHEVSSHIFSGVLGPES